MKTLLIPISGEIISVKKKSLQNGSAVYTYMVDREIDTIPLEFYNQNDKDENKPVNAVTGEIFSKGSNVENHLAAVSVNSYEKNGKLIVAGLRISLNTSQRTRDFGDDVES